MNKDDCHKITHMKLKKDMKVSELINEMGNTNVLGAGRLYRATRLFSKMLNDSEMNIFLSLAGPMIPGGMRNIVTDLIKEGHIRVLICSGANLTHDLLEAFGGSHYRDYGVDDVKLHESGLGRISDVYADANDFEVFETEITKLICELSKEKETYSIQEFLYEIGTRIDDENSFIKAAADNNVAIYSPGIIDSMLGLQLWMFNQTENLALNVIEDMHHLSDVVFEKEKVGAVMLGGGLPKHYTLASTILKEGMDAAIQITMDRSETGSLSGAPLEEAKSWAKAKAESNLVTVIGDATILFPLLVAGAYNFIE